jgi:CheY-like chemotaxis protein
LEEKDMKKISSGQSQALNKQAPEFRDDARIRKGRRRIPDIRILFASDDLETARMVSGYFESRYHYNSDNGFYEIVTHTQGGKVIKACSTESVLIAVIDESLSDMSGYELAKRLREKRDIPHFFIFLVEEEGKLPGFEHEYYIVKPYEVEEIARCIEKMKQLVSCHLGHPVTHLPAGHRIDRELKSITGRHDWSLLHIEVNVEDVFDDVQYAAQKRIMRFTADLVEDVIEEYGALEDFLGHIDSGDFIVVTQSEKSNVMAREIVSRFERSVHRVYPLEEEHSGPLVLSVVELEGKDAPSDHREFPQRVRELREAGKCLRAQSPQ